jgi:hypothetical protein
MSKEFEKEFFLPSCEFHFAADGSFIGVSAQDVERDAAQDGKILWPVILACSGVVLVESHVDAYRTEIQRRRDALKARRGTLEEPPLAQVL